MIDPRDLIDAARSLSSCAAPSDAALRRAISTAYYALFHVIAAFAADRLTAPGGTAAAYALVYRGLDHRRIRDVLDDASKPTLRLAMRDALSRTTISSELREFADVFSPRMASHAARIKVTLPPWGAKPEAVYTIAPFGLVAGQDWLTGSQEHELRRWVEANLAALLAYWEGEILYDQDLRAVLVRAGEPG